MDMKMKAFRYEVTWDGQEKNGNVFGVSFSLNWHLAYTSLIQKVAAEFAEADEVEINVARIPSWDQYAKTGVPKDVLIDSGLIGLGACFECGATTKPMTDGSHCLPCASEQKAKDDDPDVKAYRTALERFTEISEGSTDSELLVIDPSEMVTHWVNHPELGQAMAVYVFGEAAEAGREGMKEEADLERARVDVKTFNERFNVGDVVWVQPTDNKATLVEAKLLEPAQAIGQYSHVLVQALEDGEADYGQSIKTSQVQRGVK